MFKDALRIQTGYLYPVTTVVQIMPKIPGVKMVGLEVDGVLLGIGHQDITALMPVVPVVFVAEAEFQVVIELISIEILHYFQPSFSMVNLHLL